MRTFLVLSILLCTLPLQAKENLVRAHWIQWDYRIHIKKRLPLETAKLYAKSIEKWSKHYKLDPDWVTAMWTVESHWDTRACDKRPTPSYGISQIQIDTAQGIVKSWGHRFMVTPETLKNHAGLTIRLSCAHYAWLLKYYSGDTIRATRAYNAGHGAVDRSKKLPGMKHFRKVLDTYEKYKLN